MSGLPDTFPCPWCGMSYPARPVLVGKAVRCKGCRNGFVLQADGVATKIQEPPPTQSTVSQVSAAAAPPAAPIIPPKPAPPQPVVPQAPPRPAPASDDDVLDLTPDPPKAAPPAPAARPAPPTRPAPAAVQVEDVVVLAKQALAEEVVVSPKPPADVPTPKPAGPPSSAQPKSERVAKRKTEHLEAARAQMAAQLAEIQTKAANSEAAKREERKSERIAKAGSGAAVPSSGDAKRSARQAVLSGEGERHHRELRLWWVWLGAAAAIALLLMFVFSMRSSTRETLQLYAAPVEAEQNRYPLLGDVLRARAWLATAKSMRGGPLLATDLSDASFGAERTIAFEPLAAQLAELKGLRLEEDLGLWLAPGDLDKARLAIAGRTGADASKILAAAKIRHAVHSQVLQKLSLADEDAVVVIDLLTGTAPRDGEPITKRILDLGELPDRVVVRPFRGRRGSMLVDIGRPPYKPVQGPYAGIILRFEGAKWPIGWRVLHLDQVK